MHDEASRMEKRSSVRLKAQVVHRRLGGNRRGSMPFSLGRTRLPKIPPWKGDSGVERMWSAAGGCPTPADIYIPRPRIESGAGSRSRSGTPFTRAQRLTTEGSKGGLLAQPAFQLHASYFSNTTLLLWACVLLLFAAARPAHAQYVAEGEAIVAGEPVTLSLPAADTLVITYRPGSNISEVERVPVAGAAYTWTPHEAGLVALATPDGPVQTVSVRFDRAPVWGLLILFVAGGILFGGAAWASANLFGKQPSETMTDRPDT